MNTYTIPMKQSGTGNIHSIASDTQDRDIKFNAGQSYAVVLASFYGDQYTTHSTAALACKQSKKVGESHSIIDVDGNLYDADYHLQTLSIHE